MDGITIMDTGYLKIDNSGSQLTTSQRANAGMSLTLNSSDIDFTMGVICDSSITIGNWDNTTALYKLSNVVKTSISNPTLDWIIKLRNNVSADMNMIYLLITFARSKGYKILYYTGANQDKQLLYQLTRIGLHNTVVGTAHRDSGTQFSSQEQSNPHIHIRFNSSITMKQTPINNIIIVTIPLVMIG